MLGSFCGVVVELAVVVSVSGSSCGCGCAPQVVVADVSGMDVVRMSGSKRDDQKGGKEDRGKLADLNLLQAFFCRFATRCKSNLEREARDRESESERERERERKEAGAPRLAAAGFRRRVQPHLA